MADEAQSRSLMFQLQQGSLRNVRPGVVVEENWFLHIDQYKAYTLEPLVHFVDFLAVLPAVIVSHGFRKP